MTVVFYVLLLHHNSNYSYIALYPKNELTALYNIKKYRGTICTKIQRNIFFNVLYIHTINDQKETTALDRQGHFSTQTFQTTHTGEKKVKQYSFTLSAKHTNHTANVVQYTHAGWNPILLKGGEQEMCFSWDLKYDQDEQRRIFKGSEFQTSWACY